MTDRNTMANRIAYLEGLEDFIFDVLTEAHTSYDVTKDYIADLKNIADIISLYATRETYKKTAAKEFGIEVLTKTAVEAPEPEKPTTTLTKDEVKQKLLTLQNKNGVDIAAAIKSVGYAKLSDVPADKYEELIRTAESSVT